MVDDKDTIAQAMDAPVLDRESDHGSGLVPEGGTTELAPVQLRKPPNGVFARGMNVREAISGFCGMIECINHHLSGTVHFVVQAPDPSGKDLGKRVSFDADTLEFVNVGLMHLASPCDDITIELGMKVKDLITKQKGFVTLISYQFNGCVHCGVDGPPPKGDHLAVPVKFQVDHKRLEMLGAGYSKSGPTPLRQTLTGCSPQVHPR